jgi:hypothetical protein
VKEELKVQSILVNWTLKKLNKDRDFTDIIHPLTTDTGPASILVPKLKKQVDRLTKIIDDFLRQEEQEKLLAASAQDLAVHLKLV